jgi:ligand-binding sensor domain-containing protein
MNGKLDLLGSWQQALFSLVLSILSVTAALSSANAETPYHPQLTDCLTESWRWREFPQLKGRGLNCLSEGPDGAMWFGVDGGALRYDGRQWTEFGSSHGLPTTATAFAATDDDLFAATNSAVFAFGNEAWVEVFPGSTDRGSRWIIVGGHELGRRTHGRNITAPRIANMDVVRDFPNRGLLHGRRYITLRNRRCRNTG